MARKTKTGRQDEGGRGGTPIPEVFYHAIAFLLPGLNQVAQECAISIGEWIIMWHLMQAGVSNERNEPTILRRTLIDLLSQRGFGDANISRLLSSLEDKGHVLRVSVPMQERDRL